MCRCRTARRRIRVGRAFLEPLVLAHRLVVEILAVDDEQDLLDTPAARVRDCAALKLGEVLPDPVVCQTRSRRPLDTPQLPVVRRGREALQNSLGGGDLIPVAMTDSFRSTSNTQYFVKIFSIVLGEERLS